MAGLPFSSKGYRKYIAQELLKFFKLPNCEMPKEMGYAFLLAETGWSPDVLDNMPMDEVMKFLLYKKIKHIAEYGGEFVE